MPTKRPPKPVDDRKPVISTPVSKPVEQPVYQQQGNDDNVMPLILGAAVLGIGVLVLSGNKSGGGVINPPPPGEFVLSGHGDCLNPTTPVAVLAWNAIQGASTFDVLRDGSIIATARQSPFTTTSLGPQDDGVMHNYQVIAEIVIGQLRLKVNSNVITVVSGCHQPPGTQVMISAVNGFFS